MLELKWEFKGGKCVQVRWVKSEAACQQPQAPAPEQADDEALKAS